MFVVPEPGRGRRQKRGAVDQAKILPPQPWLLPRFERGNSQSWTIGDRPTLQGCFPAIGKRETTGEKMGWIRRGLWFPEKPGTVEPVDYQNQWIMRVLVPHLSQPVCHLYGFYNQFGQH